MDGYGQYCPVAKAAELVDRRWTLLVIRELVAGSRRFNDLHRGVPRMSRTQLSTRLRQLVDAGLVLREEDDDGPVYVLTEAGHEFGPVIQALGEWGIRWVDELSDDDLDPAFLLWDIHRRIDPERVPPRRTVVAITFADQPPDVRDWWLVLTRDGVDVCEHDPGHGIDLTVRTAARPFVHVWRGDTRWEDAVRDGDIRLEGPERLRRALPEWLQLSHFAPVPRPTARRDDLAADRSVGP